MRAYFGALLVALAACSGTSKSGDTQSAVAPATASSRGTGTMHVVLTTPTATSFDVSNATCLIAPRGEPGGGLHVSSATPGTSQSASVDDARIGADGADDWTALPTASMLDAPLRIHIALAGGAIFSGGPGSAAKLTSNAAGRMGTVAFGGATYAGKSGIADAAGTITWSCNPP